MRPPEEPTVLTPTTPAARSGVGLVASVVLHLLFLAGAVIASRQAPEPGRLPGRERPRVDLIPLPPIAPPIIAAIPNNPAPSPKRVPRPQVTRGRDLPPDAYFRQEIPPVAHDVGPPPAATAPEPAPEPAPRTIASSERAPASIESEAQRLFGPRRSGAGADAGPVPAQSWINALTEDRKNDCIPRARPARPPGTPVELGVVSGIVYREGSREPLGGAFLQILGTPYATFADARGAYSLSFDKSLVDDCRTQYVQVSKDGFAPRRLILSLGQRMSNDIPLSRR